VIDAATPISALLFPESFTIPSGRWRGLRRPFSLFLAMSTGTARGYFDDVSFDVMAGWNPDSMPIPAYFSDSEIAKDSSAIWAGLDRVENAIGLDLFKPSIASVHPLRVFRIGSSPSDTVSLRVGAIEIRRAPSGATGGSSLACNGQLNYLITACGTVIDYVHGSMGIAPNYAGAYTDDSSTPFAVLTTLGLDRTCMFASQLADVRFTPTALCDQYRLNSFDPVDATSAIETAYIHIRFALSRKWRQFPQSWSVRETLDGQRILQYGLPSISSIYPKAISANRAGEQPLQSSTSSCR
jgi:hypothetical protein